MTEKEIKKFLLCFTPIFLFAWIMSGIVFDYFHECKITSIPQKLEEKQ